MGAFVAGASCGLGKACAKALADEGAHVFICSRNPDEIARTAAEIGAAGYAAADVSQPAEVERVVAAAIAALGGLDCLVTNAGGPPTASFEKAGDGDCLGAKATALLGVGEGPTAQHLERDRSPQLRVTGAVDDPNAAAADLAKDLVVADVPGQFRLAGRLQPAGPTKVGQARAHLPFQGLGGDLAVGAAFQVLGQLDQLRLRQLAKQERAQLGHPPVVRTVPSDLTSLAGRPKLASQPSAGWPLTIDAVLAVFASTQVAAATETAAQ